MDDDASNDVVAINSDDDTAPSNNYGPEKPLIKLFNRLISSDNKQNTILTNAQIVDILNTEFNINLWDIHELEGEIYLTITKKYLKDWPQWDEFDKKVNTLRNKNETAELERMLESSYYNLKDYLKVMLDRAEVLAKSTLNNMIKEKTLSLDKDKGGKSDNIVLVIQAMRNQLNELIFRRPHPELNDTIFNGTFSGPTQIKISTLPIEAILNWWDVKLTILRGCTFFYERKTCHQLNHVLVNKNLLMHLNPPRELPQDLQVSDIAKTEKRSSGSISQYIALVERMQRDSPQLEPIYNFIKLDLQLLPSKIFVRSSYRRYTNKYPYVRYLSKEVENPDINSRRYDLQLEETLCPMYRVYMGPIQHIPNAVLEIECNPCNRKFSGSNIVEDLQEHFMEHHSNEPDWKCTSCNKVFTMAVLAQKWWTHRC